MSNAWPNIADVTAALQADDSSATANEPKAAPAAPVAAEADAAVDNIVADTEASKTPATPADPATAPAQNEEPKPIDPAILAAAIKGDPRKVLATLPEDALTALGEVLYPGLHKVLSKRDTQHRAEIERINQANDARLAAISSQIDERLDDLLARSMDPEQFEEFKSQRATKQAEEARKNAPTAEQVARQAELRAHTLQAWNLIHEEGFPIPEDQATFTDITPEVQAIWAAGWEESDPIKAIRAMRAKARELKTGKPAAKPVPPRDPVTGKFQPSTESPDIEKMIAERVAKALEERDVRAGLSITGLRPASGGGGGKTSSWDENRRAMVEALRTR